jgi:hypothetical protein
MIIKKFEIIKLMIKDNLVFLYSSLTPDTCYRDDGSHFSQSSSSSSLSSQEWPIRERKIRIMQKTDDVITAFDDSDEHLDYSRKNIVFSPNN